MHEVMNKAQRKYIYAVYIVFFILIGILHLNMTYVSDDAWFQSHYIHKPILECFIMYWRDSAGRFLTNTAGAVFSQLPIQIWKIVDTIVYLVIARCITILFTKDSLVENAFVCMLLLLFPVSYLNSAGYIFTSANYVYTTLGILLTFIPVQKIYHGRKPGIFLCMISFCGAIYAANQEQSAVILLVILLAAFVRELSVQSDTAYTETERMQHRETGRLLLIQFLLSLSSFMLLLLSPAHRIRTNEVGGQFSIPGYETWSVIRKIYRGYTATAANLFFQPVMLYILFTILLFLSGMFYQKKIVRIISAIPLAAEAVVAVTQYRLFIWFPEYGFGLPDMKSVYENHLRIFPLILSAVVILSVAYSLYYVISDHRKAILAILILGLGFISRVMMGFSPTLFGSSFRTFTFMLYAFLIVDAVLFAELFMKNSRVLIRVTLGLTLAGTIAAYLQSFYSI